MKKLLLAIAATLASIAGATAQGWPLRPMTMIIPFAAGGPQDVLGRVVAQRMSDILGQQIVIENITGAGGMIGSKRVADAAPDGYTFGIGTVGTHAHSQTLYKKPLYAAGADFTPVALIAETPVVLITRKDLPPNNFKEFVAYAKQNQAKMQYGSPGAGASSHIACVVLNHAIGVDVTHVPYRGAALAMRDLAGGRIDYQCEQVITAKPQIDGGTVKGLAIMTKERAPVLPDVPTALEQGTDVQTYAWSAIFLPKRASDTIVQKLNAATVQAMTTPAVATRLSELGSVIVSEERATPQYLGSFVTSEIEKWAGAIKASGVSMD